MKVKIFLWLAFKLGIGRVTDAGGMGLTPGMWSGTRNNWSPPSQLPLHKRSLVSHHAEPWQAATTTGADNIRLLAPPSIAVRRGASCRVRLAVRAHFMAIVERAERVLLQRLRGSHRRDTADHPSRSRLMDAGWSTGYARAKAGLVKDARTNLLGICCFIM